MLYSDLNKAYREVAALAVEMHEAATTLHDQHMRLHKESLKAIAILTRNGTVRLEPDIARDIKKVLNGLDLLVESHNAK